MPWISCRGLPWSSVLAFLLVEAHEDSPEELAGREDLGAVCLIQSMRQEADELGTHELAASGVDGFGVGHTNGKARCSSNVAGCRVARVSHSTGSP
jgi:hypothetical protein